MQLVKPQASRSLRALVLATVAALVACAPAPSTEAPRSPAGQSVVSTTLTNGRIEITVLPAYPVGSIVSIPLSVIATSGTITGPLSAGILAGSAGGPSEGLVRRLVALSVTATEGRRQTTMLSWDGHDETGRVVPSNAYSVIAEFRIEDSGTLSTAVARATLQLKNP